MKNEYIVVVIYLTCVVPIALFAIFHPVWSKDKYYYFPTHIYKKSKLNIFGSIVVSILAVLSNPGYCIIMTIYAIIYFIFHVGRKED